ncbi:DUF5709 domain-containing protein [Yinghuangia seranimata]|uniref:DUF5709 domain-containing protein n=1 Tax=Yinghuangia seranimata TaxID=408067 RepID=UPI00248BA629|nr:DUF5709 domain-containing protein [Yinghuangia seranimata]MDI2124676.1 DUF5709 domain-containing protein [Yinghuangia seranimata]
MPDDEARGDDVYQPDGTGNDAPDDAYDLENALDEPDLDELLDQGYSPPERPYAVEDHGTTQSEQRAGEPLDRRLARERPEPETVDDDGVGDQPGGAGEPVDKQAGHRRSGRLLAEDTGGTARDVGIDGGAASAEEAAVHTVPAEETEA